jgi:DDE_Tnp_1-like zinc-ribbon
VTANALVLYNTTLAAGENKCKINEFKPKLVMLFVGDWIKPVLRGVITPHELRQEETSRHICVWCSMNGRRKQTRYVCSNIECNLPLCSVGSGWAREDCVTAVYSSETIRIVAMHKHRSMIQ